ncbi:branched-chain amino acid transport system II carrier protein [Fusibacter sp. 3D3]|uniref:branched-chain amino acid transport system II carrier protein n=1 Tax=Fusibacter sp. 3D3 TaxID=1048380 RepID=UPI0008529F9D|nr:branched-chain amino acid transport system II carrier protein [Fusibacter sp. 3D3]GAU79981.1 branched-chain amino acid transport system carrier protein [Fusibacter sp. 3D3]
MKRQTKDSIVLGAALFAMFFGAGNLIFPPAIGLTSGNQWLFSLLGFFITGICLPVLGVLAVSKAGGTISELALKVGPKFAVVFGSIVVLAIGPLLAIPRTGATVYEIGVAPLGSVNPLLVSIIYFSVTLFFVIKPSGIIDKIGKILTPILLVVIGTIIVGGILHPVAQPVASKLENAFSYGFLQGYQTMDTLVAIVVGGIILSSLVEKGYTDSKRQFRMTTIAGLMSGTILLLIYGGLMYLGATISTSVTPEISRTALILKITQAALGPNSLLVISVAVSAACLTTSIGLTAIAGDFFEHVSGGKIPYKATVIFVCIFSTVMSVVGVDTIVEIAVPLLVFVYPIAMVLIVFNLLDRFLPYAAMHKGAVWGAGLVGAVDAFKALNLGFINTLLEPVYKIVEYLPLAKYGFAWLLPALTFSLAFGLLGEYIMPRLSHEKNVEYFRKSECENAEGINGNNYKKELEK